MAQAPPRPDAEDAAHQLITDRYPDCAAAFLAGSVVRGDATPTSDLDMVIITQEIAGAYRESFTYTGWPVEAFVHTPQSIRAWFDKDAARRRPSLQMMCREGVILRDREGLAARIKAEAARRLAAGPAPLTEAEIAQFRYRLTDLHDDLSGSADAIETLFIGAELAALASEFILAYNRQWVGRGKWIPRAMQRHDPALAGELAAAMRALAQQGDPAPLIDFVAAALEPAGGRLFDGYRLPPADETAPAP